MTILIVDDEKLAVEGIKANADFERYGITRVLAAYSMKQAIRAMEENDVDIIICDIEMPNGNGLEFLKWVKEYKPDTVSVILSSHSEFSFAQQAIHLSCMEYILKPATPEVLDNILTQAVQRVRQNDSDTQAKILGEAYVHRAYGPEDEAPTQVEQVRSYIMEHIGEELSVGELAGMVFLSQNHLIRSFKKRYGKTVIEYITDCRMSLAEKLLKESALTVTAISARVGYPNYSYFSQCFKRYTGYTPSQYRNEFGKG